jgi:hypothetical protein
MGSDRHPPRVMQEQRLHMQASGASRLVREQKRNLAEGYGQARVMHSSRAHDTAKSDVAC